jgi:hypothetical protein
LHWAGKESDALISGLSALKVLTLFVFSQPEAARIAVGVLSSLSMNRDTFPYFLPIEKDLILLAFSDRSVADYLNNIVADVYGMHAL